MPSRRRQILSDEIVQGELLFRAIVYWFFCLMTVSLLVFAWSLYSGPQRPFAVVIQESLVQSAPAIFGSVILLPVVLLDVLKVSSRFVGPIHQIRESMKRLSANEPTAPILLRKDDYWQELARYTNEVIAYRQGAFPTGFDVQVQDTEPSEDFDGTEFDHDNIPCTDTRESESTNRMVHTPKA